MPVIDYHAALNVLVAVRGHPFDRNAFAAIFDDMPGLSATMVDQPAAATLMNPDGMAPYDALVLYDMPGLDFADKEGLPGHVEPPPNFRSGFETLLDEGKGIVALHHAIAGWPAWEGYAEILGGSFLYRPARLRGQDTLDSGYRHHVQYVAEVVDPGHPVMADVPPTFEMNDELYLSEVFEADVTPLLKARYDFTQQNFYSARAAVEGRMFDNARWMHPDGSNLIGWTRQVRNSRLVYLQPGDDHMTYDNPEYRRILENAIRWVAAGRA